jgi:hypothetical protein
LRVGTKAKSLGVNFRNVAGDCANTPHSLVVSRSRSNRHLSKSLSRTGKMPVPQEELWEMSNIEIETTDSVTQEELWEMSNIEIETTDSG